MRNICNSAQMNLEHFEFKIFIDEAKEPLIQLLFVTEERDHHADRKLSANDQACGHKNYHDILETKNQAARHFDIDVQLLDIDAFIGDLRINILPDGVSVNLLAEQLDTL